MSIDISELQVVSAEPVHQINITKSFVVMCMICNKDLTESRCKICKFCKRSMVIIVLVKTKVFLNI